MWIYKDGRNEDSALTTTSDGWVLSNYGSYDREIHDISEPDITSGQAVYTITEKTNALAIVQANKEAEIREHADEVMESIVTPYWPKERETWFGQVAEAEAYIANPLASTPMLSALVLERGGTVAAQVVRILANAVVFKSAIGTVLGKQQNRLDQIYAIDATISSVRAVNW